MTMPARRALMATPLLLLSRPAAAQRAGQPPFTVTPPGPGTPTPIPGDRVIGRAHAPVEVIEWHSLTCGNCSRFHTEIFPRIKAAYIEPGLVRFVLRDYPLDRAALDAAALVHCAPAERAEALLATLYARKEDWAHASDPRAWLRRAGTLAALTPARIDACWGDRGFTDPILASRLRATEEHGVDATPSFLIGGVLHKGIIPFDRFVGIVRPLLPPGATPRG